MSEVIISIEISEEVIGNILYNRKKKTQTAIVDEFLEAGVIKNISYDWGDE